MATVNFSVPGKAKEAFNRTFAGQNKSAIAFEDRLPLIAATHDVIERPRKMHPRLPGHTGAKVNSPTLKE